MDMVGIMELTPHAIGLLLISCNSAVGMLLENQTAGQITGLRGRGLEIGELPMVGMLGMSS